MIRLVAQKRKLVAKTRHTERNRKKKLRAATWRNTETKSGTKTETESWWNKEKREDVGSLNTVGEKDTQKQQN